MPRDSTHLRCTPVRTSGQLGSHFLRDKEARDRHQVSAPLRLSVAAPERGSRDRTPPGGISQARPVATICTAPAFAPLDGPSKQVDVNHANLNGLGLRLGGLPESQRLLNLSASARGMHGLRHQPCYQEVSHAAPASAELSSFPPSVRSKNRRRSPTVKHSLLRKDRVLPHASRARRCNRLPKVTPPGFPVEVREKVRNSCPVRPRKSNPVLHASAP